MATARAFAANSPKSPLAAASIPRRDVGPNDVEFDIQFCGVCHSDLHTVRNEWAIWPTVYPCVPGHEIVGRVVKLGPDATGVKIGDIRIVNEDNNLSHISGRKPLRQEDSAFLLRNISSDELAPLLQERVWPQGTP